MSKFRVILEFEGLYFLNEATYLTLNTNKGSIDKECMSSKILV